MNAQIISNSDKEPVFAVLPCDEYTALIERVEQLEDLQDCQDFEERLARGESAIHATVFDVDVEDALEPLHPAHGHRTRRMRLASGMMDRVGDDGVALLEARCEHICEDRHRSGRPGGVLGQRHVRPCRAGVADGETGEYCLDGFGRFDAG